MCNEGLEGLNEALETTNACSGSELTCVTNTLGHSILSYFEVNLQKILFYSSKSACVQMRSSASLEEIFCHFGNSHQFRFAKEKAFLIVVKLHHKHMYTKTF